MQIIFWTQVLNTVLLVPQISALLLLNSNNQLLGEQTLTRRARVVGWIGIGIVAASVALLAVG